MKISDEKEFLYEMMMDITKERRNLTDLYFNLKERLDKLNELETKGFDNLNVQGYADLHNKNSDSILLDNLQREVDNLKKEMQEQKEENKNKIIPDFEISEQRFKDNSSKPKTTKKPKKSNKQRKEYIGRIKDLIVDVMRDSEEPMNSNMIVDAIVENSEFDYDDIDMEDFRSNLMYRVISTDKNITRVDKGMYLYDNGQEQIDKEESTLT